MNCEVISEMSNIKGYKNTNVTEACELEAPAFEPVPDPVDVAADADVAVAVAATEVEVGRAIILSIRVSSSWHISSTY